MPVRLNGSTSGYVELAAPAVAGSAALTLPAASGALAVRNFASASLASSYSLSTTSTSRVLTSLQVTITPSSASAKILVMAYDYYLVSIDSGFNTSNTPFPVLSGFDRNGTSLTLSQSQWWVQLGPGLFQYGMLRTPNSAILIDSPGTTSPVTYTLQIASSASTAQAQIGTMTVTTPTIFAKEV